MIFYFINPHQNYSLGKTLSSLVTFRITSSKINFIFNAVISSGKLGVLMNNESFPELPPTYPRSPFVNKLDIKIWSFNKKIKNILYQNDLNKSLPNDYLFLTTKDTKYKNILEILSNFQGKIILLLDDHLFSTYEKINKIIDCVGPNRIKSASVTSIRNNPFFTSMPISSIKETVIGWPVSERFLFKKDFSKRFNRVLVLGTLTYRQFNNDLMKKLSDNKFSCVHPDREYFYKNYSCSKYIDSKIPMRDYLFNDKKFIDKIFKRINNKYSYMKYSRINLPVIMNNYKFVIYPPLFNQLPCLGMLEVMASGALLIGTNSYAYKSLGLIENYNYVSIGKKMDVKIIDNIVEDELKNKNKYLRIQQNSLKWVEKFREANFIKKFDLNQIL